MELSEEVRSLMTSVDLVPDPHGGAPQAPEAFVGCLKHMMLGSGVRADLSAAEFSLLWGAGSIRSPLRWCHVPHFLSIITPRLQFGQMILCFVVDDGLFQGNPGVFVC